VATGPVEGHTGPFGENLERVAGERRKTDLAEKPCVERSRWLVGAARQATLAPEDGEVEPEIVPDDDAAAAKLFQRVEGLGEARCPLHSAIIDVVDRRRRGGDRNAGIDQPFETLLADHLTVDEAHRPDLHDAGLGRV